METLYHTDAQGVCHMTDQGVIELAYQDLLEGALFEWQTPQSKQQYERVSAYLDSWPHKFDVPDPSDRQWFTPAPYDQIDLDAHVLARCASEQARVRATCELKIIHHLGVNHIFRHLIYLVDTWRSEGLVWGVGRGSSVSCFVLYVIGVNRINPLDYELPMTEFFKLSEDEILNIINSGDITHG